MPDSLPFAPRRRTGLLVPGRRPEGREAVPSVAGLLARPGLHEVYGASVADGSAALGFVLGAVAGRLKGAGTGPRVVWVRQEWLSSEAGHVHAPGLMEHGIAPSEVALVAARDMLGLLQAGLEAARCDALSAVILEFEGATRLYDLTASRRLARAALASGLGLFVLRHGAEPVPSAAETRWQVAARASRALQANAAGFPAFDVTLLRNRAGREGAEWAMEWNRDGLDLVRRPEGGREGAALSGALVPVSADRTAWPRRAG